MPSAYGNTQRAVNLLGAGLSTFILYPACSEMSRVLEGKIMKEKDYIDRIYDSTSTEREDALIDMQINFADKLDHSQ